ASSGAFAYFRWSDAAIFGGSDGRLKRDITPLGGVLERVLQLRPVSYHFRSAPDDAPLTLGFIAQVVEPLFPDDVGERAGMTGLAYSELVPDAIGGIQELNQKVEELERELQRRDAENADLRHRLETLERIISNQR